MLIFEYKLKVLQKPWKVSKKKEVNGPVKCQEALPATARRNQRIGYLFFDQTTKCVV